MSITLTYNCCSVGVKFENKEDLIKRVKAFKSDVAKWDRHCKRTDYEDTPTGALVEEDTDKLYAYIYVKDDGESFYDTDKLAELICKHFPTANGSIGWASVDLRGGYCTYANGDTLEIKQGKVVPPLYCKVDELKRDLQEALDYISMVVNKNCITECGVAHLFKKYCPEDYKQALQDKEDI